MFAWQGLHYNIVAGLAEEDSFHQFQVMKPMAGSADRQASLAENVAPFRRVLTVGGTTQLQVVLIGSGLLQSHTEVVNLTVDDSADRKIVPMDYQVSSVSSPFPLLESDFVVTMRRQMYKNSFIFVDKHYCTGVWCTNISKVANTRFSPSVYQFRVALM